MLEVRPQNVATGIMVVGLLAVNIGSRLVGYHWARFSSPIGRAARFQCIITGKEGWPLQARDWRGNGAGLHQVCLIQAPEGLEQTVAVKANPGPFLLRNGGEDYDRQ